VLAAYLGLTPEVPTSNFVSRVTGFALFHTFINNDHSKTEASEGQAIAELEGRVFSDYDPDK
jgi:hypothetical protein